MRLVADIGGTNARLAFVTAGGSLINTKTYKNAKFDSFKSVVERYLADTDQPEPTQVVAAVAGPVMDNVGRMTNLPWVVDGAALSERYNDIPVQIINDLSALGYSALGLQDTQCSPVISVARPVRQQRQALVVGIGTGCNVSPVIERGGRTICAAAEAGHFSLPSRICAVLDAIKPNLSAEFPTIEALLSGRGRRKFMTLVTGTTVTSATTYLVKFSEAGNEVFDEALDHYTRLIGYMIIDLNLAYMPLDGVFLAGGVMRSSLEHGRDELLKEVLQSPGQFLDTKIPAWLITDDAAALVGCARLEIT